MKKITFPILNLYEFQCDETLTENFYNDIFSREIDWVKAASKTKEINPFAGYIQTSDFFFNKDWFDWAHSCLAQIHSLYFDGGKLQICDYWLTKSSFGNASPQHSHHFSIFSGVFYFTDQELSSTRFTYLDTVSEKFGLFQKNKFGPQELFITPKRGKLIVFPSFVEHGYRMVERNVRYSLAFNSFLTGTINSSTTAKLKIDVQNL